MTRVKAIRHAAAVLLFACAPWALADAEHDFVRGYEAYVRSDYSQALSLWRKAAEQGHPRAQNGLGVLYRDALGTANSDADAVKWFRESAEKGYAYAMFNLGLMYREGKGVARDQVESLKWLTLASTIDYDGQAARERDLLGRSLTSQQRQDALARAQAWMDRFFFGDSRTRSRVKRMPVTE
jgi:TPR repeat protein